jgi:beta-glucosidase
MVGLLRPSSPSTTRARSPFGRKGFVGTGWDLYELPQSTYAQGVIDNAKAYSNTALVVLTRKGEKDYGLPTNMADCGGSEVGRSYLELTPNE